MVLGKIFASHQFASPNPDDALHLDLALMDTLCDLAGREGITVNQIATELLTSALALRQDAFLGLENWRSLSPREQDVAAYTCLRYTNQQIAAKLIITQETVKTHLRNILNKFDLHSKEELRRALAGLDFSSWESRTSG